MARPPRGRDKRGAPNQSAAAPRPRLHLVDALRGAAVALMVGYHFCYDLDYFHLVSIDFHGTFWMGARALIVSMFLALAGASLHLATADGLRLRPFLRRVAVLAGCAGAVSVASYILFPASGIFFGVLHFIAVASVLALPLRGQYAANLLLGAVCICAGLFLHHPAFDHPWASWIGFTTHNPITEDYVPIFPWFGVVAIGMFLGRWFLQDAHCAALRSWRPASRHARLLAGAGRNALWVYMAHQPILMGAIYLCSGGA